jgi:hypothetical protein
MHCVVAGSHHSAESEDLRIDDIHQKGLAGGMPRGAECALRPIGALALLMRRLPRFFSPP